MPAPAPSLTPLLPTLFGWLNTLKASKVERTFILSRILKFLNRETSWFHWRGPPMYWLRRGFRLGLKVVRTTVPLFKGTHTVLVSQKVETSVPAGILGCAAVEPQGINGVENGL